MSQDENKKNTKYGSIFLYCLFCLVFVVEVTRFTKPYVNLPNLMERKSTEVEEGLDVEINGISPCHFMSSRDQKKLSGERTFYRTLPPTSYCVKFESFKTMSKQIKEGGKYESRPFSVGGYNWTFLIYPDGNRQDGINGQVSVYAKIDNSSLIPEPQEVYAEIKFFAFKRSEDKYYIYQETEAQRFHLFRPKWGKRDFLPTGYFRDWGAGWLFNGDQTVFGIDIFVAKPFQKWELFSYEQNIRNPIFNWKLANFSKLYSESYTSKSFSSGQRNWKLKVYPNGIGPGSGNSLSLFLVRESNEKAYVKAKLRVYDQIQSNHVEKTVEGWPSAIEDGWGFDKFVSIAELGDTSKGYLVNDTLKVEVEILSFSKTDFIN